MRILILEDIDLPENPENRLFPFDLLILHQNHKVRPRRNFADFFFCVNMNKIRVLMCLNPEQRLKSGVPVTAGCGVVFVLLSIRS